MRNKFIYMLLLFLLFIVVYQCKSGTDNQKRWAQNTQGLTDSITHYKNKLGTITASKRVLEYNAKELQEQLLAKDEELKALVSEFYRVKNVVKYKTITRVDTIRVTFTDSISIDFSKNGRLLDKWYSFNYNVDNKGFTIYDLEIPTEATLITGYKKKWFLGRQSLVTTVTHSNPNIVVVQLQSATEVVPNPWYTKWYVWLGAGAVGGMLMR